MHGMHLFMVIRLIIGHFSRHDSCICMKQVGIWEEGAKTITPTGGGGPVGVIYSDRQLGGGGLPANPVPHLGGGVRGAETVCGVTAA